jgi:hypothetical protein
LAGKAILVDQAMRRTSVMTLGFVLIFVGIQLNLVESYVLTPRISSFLSEQASSNPSDLLTTGGASNRNAAFNSPYYQTSYPAGGNLLNRQNTSTLGFGAPKTIRPPSWICWPVLFLGTVVFLHGFSMKRE